MWEKIRWLSFAFPNKINKNKEKDRDKDTDKKNKNKNKNNDLVKGRQCVCIYHLIYLAILFFGYFMQ